MSQCQAISLGTHSVNLLARLLLRHYFWKVNTCNNSVQLGARKLIRMTTILARYHLRYTLWNNAVHYWLKAQAHTCGLKWEALCNYDGLRVSSSAIVTGRGQVVFTAFSGWLSHHTLLKWHLLLSRFRPYQRNKYYSEAGYHRLFTFWRKCSMSLTILVNVKMSGEVLTEQQIQPNTAAIDVPREWVVCMLHTFRQT